MGGMVEAEQRHSEKLKGMEVKVHRNVRTSSTSKRNVSFFVFFEWKLLSCMHLPSINYVQ